MPSSSRSPYPTRSRSRRLAQEQHRQQDGETDESTAMPEDSSSATPTAASAYAAGGQDAADSRTRGLYTPNMPIGGAAGAPNVSARANRMNRMPRTSLGSVGSTGSGNFRLGQGLLHARLSPINAASNASMQQQQQQQQLSTSSISPASTSSSMSFSMPSSSAKPKRFFPAVSTTREAESEQDKGIHIDVPNQKPKLLNLKEEYLDGMPIHQLRSLAEQQHSSQISVFYAGIVFAKTQKPSDAYLYASLLVENKEFKRAVRLLETTGLLHYTYSNKPFAAAVGETNGTNNEDAQLLILPATLLAAQALSHLEEWQSMLTLLEDSILYTTLSNLTANGGAAPNAHVGLVLEDDDDIAWMALGEQVLQYQQNNHNSNDNRGYPSNLPPMNQIHPLALLLNLRATAYSKTGHPLRASIFWKKALQLDPKCVPALDGYLESTSVLDSESALTPQQLVDSLVFPPNFEFLKDFYLAKLLGGIASRGNNADAANKLDTTQNSNAPFWHDEASSIQLTSPKNAMGNNHNDTLDLSMSARSMDFKAKKKEDEAKTHNPTPLDQLWRTHKLQKSSDVLAMAAEKAYQQHDFHKALKLCEKLSQLDPLCPTAGYTYVATLVSLQKKRPLFSLAHEWVDAAPKSSKAWFAVGAYYYACQRYHVAQRHFCRATRLDPHSPEAWIAFGTSFAMCDESDQALASFRAAQRLSPGDATSLLYIGMEYLRTNHLVLAHHFLQASHHANPHDPLGCNEIGVLYMTTSFQNTDYDVTPTQKYEMAIEWLTKALVLATGHVSSPRRDKEPNNNDEEVATLMELLQSTSLRTMSNGTYWEPTLFNLAIAHRKLKNYKLAIDCLTVCLSWKESASAYAALGYCHHLQHFTKQIRQSNWTLEDEEDGQHIHMAIEHYHQSLSRKPDDPFCTEMLQRALSDALEEQVFLPPTPDDETVRKDSVSHLEMNKMQNRAMAAAATAMTPTNNDQSSMMLTTNDDGGFSFSIDHDDDSDVDMG